MSRGAINDAKTDLGTEQSTSADALKILKCESYWLFNLGPFFCG